MKLFYSLLFVALVANLQAQSVHTHLPDRAIDFPHVPGYLTLKSDLHMHSVFSDGDVWPNIRVQEAQRDGLDIVSMTEHLEYLPHKEDIPLPDRNRAHEIATNTATNSDLIVIRGSEITRSMPPGHANAIFIQDANKLVMEDAAAVFKEAHDQGAFIFWNHPNWTPQALDGIAKLSPMHHELIAKGYLNGIEVVNEDTYSEEALQIAIDNNLTIMGTSDIHGLVDWQFDVPSGGHRPITLIFARERSEASIKEALFAGRTVVWFNETLIGRINNLEPLIMASVIIENPAVYQRLGSGKTTQVLEVKFTNNSDASFMLFNKSGYTFHANDDLIMLEPHSVTTLQVKTLTAQTAIDLKFTVLNAVTAPDTHPDLVWHVKVAEQKNE